MRMIPVAAFKESPSLYKEIAVTLKQGKVVCFPGGSSYRLAVDVLLPEAVNTLVQLKRRTRNAPALVFIPDIQTLSRVADGVDPAAEKLMKTCWPGPLTLLFEPAASLDHKVAKIISKAHGQVGVRIPEHPVAFEITRVFGGPLLVSSANVASKQGAGSVAQVKKNFGRFLDLLVDAGDLARSEPSTVAEVTAGGLRMVREGALKADRLQTILDS